jgi:hypothetical protein
MRYPKLIFLLLYLAQAVNAQTVSLEISVTDGRHTVIENAVVRLKKDAAIIKETSPTPSGKIIFADLKTGEYVLEIEAPGFKSYSEIIEIKARTTQITIPLEVAQIVENVTVEQSKQDKTLDPREGAFTNFLTKAEIEALPDDPILLKKALQEKFGEDAEFLVDSFSSDRLPPKSQIVSIKVSQSSFDAEYHKIGIAIIEITTKPASKFFGFLSFDFNDESLNAREPFSLIRYPEQNRSLGLILWSPIKKEKTSFVVAFSNNSSYRTSIITAKTPDEKLDNPLRIPLNQQNFDGKITHNLSQFQTINLGYSFNRNDSPNLGIGGFDLPDRAFHLKSQKHQIRYSQVGNVGERFYNEFRFQFANETVTTISAGNESTTIVLDAFSNGGAGNDSKSQRQTFSVADNFLWGVKNHALKIGGVLEYDGYRNISAENQNGTFIFSSLDEFLLNKPSVFTQKLGTRSVSFSQFQIGAFIQDDIRLNKSLMISLGLRYEWQNNLNDKNNFSPRIGFAWSPKENGKTTFRGGAGIFYNWLEPNTLATILSQDENQTGETVIINPSFPNPFSGGTSQVLPKSYWQKASNLKNPYFILAQFGIQRQLTEKASLRMQYTYQKGVHQFRSRDVNAPLNFIRPNPTVGRVLQFESSAFLVINSLKADFSLTPSKTTFFSTSYRLAKSISDADGYFGLPFDNFNLGSDRSVSNNDQRHNVYATFLWALPKQLRFSLIFQAKSPLPYTITTGKDDNGDTVFNDRPIGFLRNSERGDWQKRFDASISWQFNLGERISSSQNTSAPTAEFFSGRTIKLVINATNLFNQTNFTNYVGVQTSPFFQQPVAADNSRKIEIGLRFSF